MSVNTPVYRRKYYHETKGLENAKRLRRSEHLKKRFGITIDDYDEMLVAQDGRCAICSGPPSGRYKRFHVDHDHVTDEIRALLCHHCNVALGLAEDDPRLLRAMADYLERHQPRKE